MIIHRSVFTPADQDIILSHLRALSYRQCPSFLGSFLYSRYNTLRGLPDEVITVLKHMISLVPDQEFNTLFIQKYITGSYVSNHRDPKNNIGHTIIAPFGYFEAISTIGNETYEANSGDVIVQECTINNVQGKYHSVTDIVGERYCLILNTIL